MAMQITSDTDFQKPSFHIKNSDIALRNLIEKKRGSPHLYSSRS